MADRPLIGLRTDAGARLGLGHLQRLQALASALRCREAHVRFIVTEPSAPVLVSHGVPAEEILIQPMDTAPLQDGIGVVVMDTLWSGNAPATAAAAAALQGAGRRVAVIDSMPPDQFDTLSGASAVDLVVTPYLNAERLRIAPRATRWLAGPEFAILGPEYAALRQTTAERPDPPRLLVTCGGADPDALSAGIVEHLAAAGWPASHLGEHLAVDVALGPVFQQDQVARLKRLAADHSALTLHAAPESLAPLIARASLVVGRLGLVRYEAAALRRGGVFLHGSDAYRAYLEGFAQAGLSEVFFGNDPGGRAAFLDRIFALAQMLAQGQTEIDTIFPAGAFEVVEAAGAARVAEAILELAR